MFGATWSCAPYGGTGVVLFINLVVVNCDQSIK